MPDSSIAGLAATFDCESSVVPVLAPVLELEPLDAANSPRRRSSGLQQLSVLVPLRNERWTIEALLKRVLTSPISLKLEVIVVDDASTDGSGDVVERIAGQDPRVRLVRQPCHKGKGAAVRRAIAEMSGDVAVIQDADLEYDPHEYPALLEPILAGDADAVFGSRFTGPQRRVHLFWHSLGNRLLTLIGNIFNDLNLTDMETCYKMVRSDILRELRLVSDSFTIEPELTSRLAQWGARIFEVPVSYRGRTAQDGKKTRALDGFKALAELVRCRFVDPRFTNHTGMFVLRSLHKAQRYNRWLVQQIRPYLGRRVAEAGAGIGNMSQHLVDREHLLLVDHDPMYVAMLKDRFRGRGNVHVTACDLTAEKFAEPWVDHELDTVFCSNVLEHLGPDRRILSSFHQALVSGGHCIIIVPAESTLYTGLDEALGHHRRYQREALAQMMREAGFEVVHAQQMCKVGSLAWLINGRVLRRRKLTPRQMLWFDRLWTLMQSLDKVLPWPGMSLIVVGRKK